MPNSTDKILIKREEAIYNIVRTYILYNGGMKWDDSDVQHKQDVEMKEALNTLGVSDEEIVKAKEAYWK